jgi:hypothetical protein
MEKETIFKEIRNRAVKDDTDLGDIIYDVLNELYPNELKKYDLSVLDPRRGIMNPYDIISEHFIASIKGNQYKLKPVIDL